jgi:ABC-type multidrug transport system ATPase subunit
MSVDERARAGLFLAMQYPVEIPGVSVSNFLRTAKTALSGEAPALRTWIKDLRGAMDALKMDSGFTERNVNEGFSGGEKKRHEILQLELLKPKIAILDETDSGLDVDALKVVSEGVNRAKGNSDLGVLLITHYTRILKYIKPDFVHVFVAGQVAEEGVKLEPGALTEFTWGELLAVLPSVNLRNTEWSTYSVDRAEGATSNGSRPESIQVLCAGNVTTGWPTKLVLAPVLANEIATRATSPYVSAAFDTTPFASWPRPEVAAVPWEAEDCRWWKVGEAPALPRYRAA